LAASLEQTGDIVGRYLRVPCGVSEPRRIGNQLGDRIADDALDLTDGQAPSLALHVRGTLRGYGDQLR